VEHYRTVELYSSALLEFVPNWSQWGVIASQCSEDVVQWFDDDSDTLTEFTSQPLSEVIEAMAKDILKQSESIDTRSIMIEFEEVVKVKAEIEGRLALLGATDTIKAEDERQKFRVRIEAAKRSVDTGVITRKITELTRDYVTQPVPEHFVDECHAVRVKKVAFNNQPSSKGNVRNRPGPKGRPRASAGHHRHRTDAQGEGERTGVRVRSGYW